MRQYRKMREMSPELPESEALELLAKPRRRHLLAVLRESSTPVTMSELADRVGDLEHRDPTDADHRAIRLSLYHNHLPRLRDAGVIEYEGDERPVALGANFDSLLRAFDAVTGRERSRPEA